MPPPNPNTWCPPLHHMPKGPTDPANTILPNPFTVLIVGASRGIGAGCALAFAKARASAILLAARTQSALTTVAGQVKDINPECAVHTAVCDATNEQDIIRLVERTRQVFAGHLDVLLINAGITPPLITNPRTGLRDFPHGLIETPLPDFRRLMELNLLAAWTLSHHLLPLLEETADGAQALVYMASAAAHYVDAHVMSAAYSLSKFAGTRLVEHVHEGHQDKGVVAFAVQPGGVMTEGTEVPEGRGWEERLIDDVELAGSWIVWLTKEKRTWLSGRYTDARWDTEELERRRQEIVEKDLLKFRLTMT